MGLIKFTITFQGELGVFYPGQLVSGTVHVVLDKPKKISCLMLEGSGKAKVSFSEQEQYTVRQVGVGPSSSTAPSTRTRTETRTVLRSQEERYFSASSVLFGNQTGSEGELAAGEHFFPFTILLPANLPSSFESTFGKIRYCVNASLVRPRKFNHDTRVMFTVIAPLDLNLRLDLKQRVERCLDKSFGLVFKSGILKLNVILPESGAVPGGMFRPTIIVDNSKTSVSLSSVKLQLLQACRYYAEGRNKSVTTKVALKVLEAVPPKQYRKWEHVQFQVPALPPSNLEHCSIIDLDYTFRVKCVPTGMHRDFEVQIPVVIGTIPYQQSYHSSTSVQPMPQVWNTTPSAPYELPCGPSEPISGLYPDLPPPSYEQAMTSRQSPAATHTSMTASGNPQQLNENHQQPPSMMEQPFTPLYLVHGGQPQSLSHQ